MLLVKVAVHSNATLPILFVFLFLYCNCVGLFCVILCVTVVVAVV